MSSVTYDQLRTLYRTLLVFATVGVLILATGLVEFAYFEPPGQTTGARAHVVGIFKFDPVNKQTVGADRSEFARDEEFAAVVDWTTIPANLTVDARWYDSFGSIDGQVGPSTPPELASDTVIPVLLPPGYHYVLPGTYTFVVERLKDGVPVEVLGRRFVVVDR